MNMITITVDNKEVQVPSGVNLIEALKTIGIETPHLCYHKDLPVCGNCRQCLVEIEGPRGMALTIACYTPVRAGMKVATPASSPRVAEARRAVLEFLLVNHPLDCPICDKAGECLLQENYIMAGASDSRLNPGVGKLYHGNPEHSSIDNKGQRRGGKRVDLGPRIVLDEERCIQCSRCVRFMRHVAGSEQLVLASRGGHTYITTFPGEKLDHPYDRCLTDICPVGALTDKAFRFKKRVWALSRTPTVSMGDSYGANIWADHADGIIYRIMPRGGWILNTARDVVEEVHKNRLLGGDIPATSQMLKETKGKIAIVLGSSCTVEEIDAFKKLASTLGERAKLFANTNELTSGIELLITVAIDFHNEEIPKHIALTPFNSEIAKKATFAIGIRHWLENSGTMIDKDGLEQKLQGVPTKESLIVEDAKEIAEAMLL
jgi:NADH-quinone oxidoreductase subunit G